MASSQARLLNLTARMHQIEYKAAKLEAQKLQLSNESSAVYDTYLEALDATKIQYATLGSDGSINYVDANYLAFVTSNSMYLKNISDDKIYVTYADAEKYNLDGSGEVGTLSEFMVNAGYIQDIESFSEVGNTTSTSYSAVKTSTSSGSRVVPNYSADIGYQSDAAEAAAASYDLTNAVAVSSVTDSFDADTIYTISSAEDLVALASLVSSGLDTTGVTFVVTSDIDMSGVDWTGIGTSSNAFQGIFDGCGYTISNLTGSSGLFNYVSGDATATIDDDGEVTVSATYGIVKNVVLSDVNITSTAQGVGVGALIGKCTSGYVDNCYTSGELSAYNWCGGLIGWNVSGVITSSTSEVDVTATGAFCTGGLIGHDTNGIIVGCVSTGNVTGYSGNTGGFIGHEDSSGSGYIYNCATTSEVTATACTDGTVGAFIGAISPNGAVIVVDCQYADGLSEVGVIYSGGTLISSGSEDSLSSDAEKTVDTTNVTIPSQESMISNILYAIEKSGLEVGDDFESLLSTWLSQFYEEDTNYSDGILVSEALLLASINDYLTAYIEGDTDDSSVVSALIEDIENGTLTATETYQGNYEPTDIDGYEYTAYASDSSDTASKTTTITTGSYANIAGNIYTVLRAAGYTDLEDSEDVLAIQEWLESTYSSEDELLELAELNNYILSGDVDADELAALYNAIMSGGTYSVPDEDKVYTDEYADYVVVMSAQDQDLYYEDGWDVDDPDIAEAISFYELIKGGYIIVTDDQASSTEWLTNMINSGLVVLGIASQEECEDEWEFEETSVATNTSLREVSDETNLKKAEAQYEADMLKIDKKERRYDTDLAAVETEREAISSEIDTLKSVASDNVERTFKLFS